MKDSKLLETLKNFSKEDLKSFSTLLNSPIYNTNESCIALFRHLAKCIDQSDEAQLSKPIVFQEVFPDVVYNDNRLRQVIFKLNKLCEKYLVWKVTQEEDRHLQLYLEELHLRNAYGRSFKLIEKRIKDLQKRPVKSRADYFELYQLNDRMYHHVHAPKKGAIYPYMLAAEAALEKHFILGKLILITEQQQRLAVGMQEEREHWLDAEVKVKVESWTEEEREVTIDLYYKVLSIIGRRDDQAFDEIADLLELYLKDLSKYDLGNLLTYLTNYTIRRINQNEEIDHFRRKYVDLSQLGIDAEILVVNKTMSNQVYTNSIAVMLRLGDYKSASDFIKKYKPFLSKKDRQSTYLLNLSYWAEAKGDFLKALEYLSEIEDFSYRPYLVKSLRIRLYYELATHENSYHEPLLHDLNASIIFFRRRNENGKVKMEKYLNFAKVTKQIINQKEKKNKTILKKIELKIESEKSLYARYWLREKLEALI